MAIAMETEAFIRLVTDANAARPGRHVLAPGLSEFEWREWSVQWPGVGLPADLLTFYRRMNGFQLCVTRDQPNGFIELLSLRRTIYAPRLLYPGTHEVDRKYPPSCIALAPDCDHADVLTLNLESGDYFAVDPIAGIEADGCLGGDWRDALDWICRKASLIGDDRG